MQRRRPPTREEAEKILEAQKMLGASPNEIQAPLQAPNIKEATRLLEELKDRVNKRFKALATELHPDHNEGQPDQVEKAEKLRVLIEVREAILELSVGHRPPPRPRPQPVRPTTTVVVVQGGSPFGSYASSSTASTTSGWTASPGFGVSFRWGGGDSGTGF